MGLHLPHGKLTLKQRRKIGPGLKGDIVVPERRGTHGSRRRRLRRRSLHKVRMESDRRVRRPAIRCNPRDRRRQGKASPTISRQRTNAARRNGLFPKLMGFSYPGVLIPFLSISTAFSSRLNRVSSFLASVIQRQYSLRWV